MLYYKGVPIYELSNEELIEALEAMYETLQVVMKQKWDDINSLFGDTSLD